MSTRPTATATAAGTAAARGGRLPARGATPGRWRTSIAAQTIAVPASQTSPGKL